MSGCGTQCDSVCASFNTCKLDSNPPERFVAVDCANFCGFADALNARATKAGIAGCDQKWTAHLNCWQQNISKICDTDETACDQSAADWDDCIVSYCETLGPDDYDPECDGGANLLTSPFQSGF
jgi:hypothetical protein